MDHRVFPLFFLPNEKILFSARSRFLLSEALKHCLGDPVVCFSKLITGTIGPESLFCL